MWGGLIAPCRGYGAAVCADCCMVRAHQQGAGSRCAPKKHGTAMARPNGSAVVGLAAQGSHATLAAREQ